MCSWGKPPKATRSDSKQMPSESVFDAANTICANRPTACCACPPWLQKTSLITDWRPQRGRPSPTATKWSEISNAGGRCRPITMMGFNTHQGEAMSMRAKAHRGAVSRACFRPHGHWPGHHRICRRKTSAKWATSSFPPTGWPPAAMPAKTKNSPHGRSRVAHLPSAGLRQLKVGQRFAFHENRVAGGARKNQVGVAPIADYFGLCAGAGCAPHPHARAEKQADSAHFRHRFGLRPQPYGRQRLRARCAKNTSGSAP